MLTYQIRERHFVIRGVEPKFPARVAIRATLTPPEPFGIGEGRKRITIQHNPARVLFDPNTGRHWVDGPGLAPLKAQCEGPAGESIEFRGNEVTLSAVCGSIAHLKSLCEALYYGAPVLLNLDFHEAPVIERISGVVNDLPFRWELKAFPAVELDVTTQEYQEARASKLGSRLRYLIPKETRRLTAALHFFHVACRLARTGNTPWEFMSEILLNFAKTLEALFPSGGDGKTQDAARRGLASVGYSAAEIERDFIPCMALRNYVDVGHVTLALFTSSQLQVLQRYSEGAEPLFREMLNRVLGLVESGKLELEPMSDLTPRAQAVRVIDRLGESMGPEE